MELLFIIPEKVITVCYRQVAFPTFLQHRDPWLRVTLQMKRASSNSDRDPMSVG